MSDSFEGFRIVESYKTSDLKEIFGENISVGELLSKLDHFEMEMGRRVLTRPENNLRGERRHYIVEWTEVNERDEA